MKFLAISGSLRAASINTAWCRTAAALALPPVSIEVLSTLGSLPLFNPDLEASPPPAVQAWRSAVGHAAALIIASPEYAHGVSGPLKNALDWLVSHEAIVGKPIALVNTSPRAHHAQDALREILRTMSTLIVPAASVSVPLLGTCTTEAQMRASPEVCRAVGEMTAALVQHVSGGAVPEVNFPLS